jgi:transposase
MVVVVGIDVHKGTHTAVAVDAAGRQLAQRMVRATSAGHQQLVRWAGQVRVQVVERSGAAVAVEFAVEDCRHLTVGLERDLLTAGEVVVRVPPKLMAQARSSARTRGKSDPIDALAIARAALREPGLPRAEHSPVSRQVKLLVDHREDLVAMRTAAQNRLRWHLHSLNQVTAGGQDQVLDPPARSLDVLMQLDRLATRVESIDPDALTIDLRITRRVALELIADIRAWTVRANGLEREIATLMADQAPRLLQLRGCGALTAAKLVGESAGAGRSGPRPRSRCTPGSHRCRRPRARPTGIASPEAGTGNSTPRCTASRSLRFASPTASDTATTSAGSLEATPRPRRCAPSRDVSPASSTAS